MMLQNREHEKVDKKGNGKSNSFEWTIEQLKRQDNYRVLPLIDHQDKWIKQDGHCMLNLSSNDYLGLASDISLRNRFMYNLPERDFLFSSSSSRLLTGNYPAYTELEQLLSELFGTEKALTFSSGYHMNVGILPAVSDVNTLILADKLVHASLIDGIRLSTAHCIRYRHQDYKQLESLLAKYHTAFARIIIVTESIFSMDGDVTSLNRLVALKNIYSNVMLYVDEAHGIGVRGKNGLGIAEEQGCLHDIDFLCGTFGKAIASMGAYVVCRKTLYEYLINRMRTFIFSTALPPIVVAWTKFVLSQLDTWEDRRKWLSEMSDRLRQTLREKGYAVTSESHIVPLIIGASDNAILKSSELQHNGFYVLPVRPPTVPEGTSRLRFSLSAALTETEITCLCNAIR